MRIFGGIEDDGDRGRRDWESTHAKKGAPVWALNTRYYSNTSGISSGLTLLMVGRTGWLLLPPPPTEISNVAWVWGCLAFLNNVGYICKSQDYHFQRYHSLSDLPLIVVSLYHCLLYCLTPGPVLAFRDTWNAKQEFVLIMQYWFIQAGKKENAGGICKDWWLSNSVGFWDSFCFHFDWV